MSRNKRSKPDMQMTKAVDSVCLKELDPRLAAAVSRYRNRPYYFCSTDCRDKFQLQPQVFLNKAKAKRVTVAVFSEKDDPFQHAGILAYRLGEAVAKRGYILSTVARPGLALECALGAKNSGGMSVGISPARSINEHIQKYLSFSEPFDVVIYRECSLTGQKLANIRLSDMVVFLGINSESQYDYAVAHEEGKQIGVVVGMAGHATKRPVIANRFANKISGEKWIFEADPERLVARMARAYNQTLLNTQPAT